MTSKALQMGVPRQTGTAKDAEAALVSRARSGEELAFQQLVQKYQSRVYRLALRTCGTPHDAEDVVQEAFLVVFRRLHSFRGDASFGTWLYRVVMNAALMHRRKTKRRPTQSLTDFLPRFRADGRHVRIDVDYGEASRIESLVEQRELSQLLRDAIGRMPERYRAPMVLRDLEELSTAEVATILAIDERAVRQRLHRARLMLRGYLGTLAGKEGR